LGLDAVQQHLRHHKTLLHATQHTCGRGVSVLFAGTVGTPRYTTRRLHDCTAEPRPPSPSTQPHVRAMMRRTREHSP
jgi:hypothetical protein